MLFRVTAATDVTGAIATATTWSLSQSPYKVVGNIVISSGVTLTIEPGVEVQFSGEYELIVQGTLNAAGTETQKITWKTSAGFSPSGASASRAFLRFADANLALSTIKYFDMNGATKQFYCIKVGQESEHNQGQKNTNSLTVENSVFEGCLIRTDGYSTTATLDLYDATIKSSEVRGTYPRSEPINVYRSLITDTALNHDSYHNGFTLENCTVYGATFSDGCCNPGFDIKGSTLVASGGMLGGAFTNSAFINSSIAYYDSVTVTRCTFDFSEAPATPATAHMSGRIPSMLDSYITCHGSAIPYFGIQISSSSTFSMSGVTIKGCSKGLQLSSDASGSISNSQFIDVATTCIENLSDEAITATSNYWGVTSAVTIPTKINDFYDNVQVGIVQFTPFRMSPGGALNFTNVSIAPPAAIVSGPVNVTGAISTDWTWTKVGNPYIIIGNIVISSGVTLTIEPGVEVQFSGEYELIVQGTLNAAGTETQKITWKTSAGFSPSGASASRAFLRFADANLALSTIKYFDMNGATKQFYCIKVGQESEHNQGQKNTNSLTVENSVFEGCLIRTDGYSTTATLDLYDATIKSSEVRGTYPRSEPINVYRSLITDTALNHDSYHNGFTLENCTVYGATFSDGCCNPGFDIKGSTLVASGGMLGGAFTNSAFINSSIAYYDSVTVTRCTFDFSEAPATPATAHMSGRIPSMLDSYITCHGSAIPYFGIQISSSSTFSMSGVTIKGCSKGLQLSSDASGSISNSQFIDVATTCIENLSDEAITATSNYWGTTDTATINQKIQDFSDNINYGVVSYTPILSSQLPTLCLKDSYCMGGMEISCPVGAFCPPLTKSPWPCVIRGTFCAGGIGSAALPCAPGSICRNTSSQGLCPPTKWSYRGEYEKCNFCPDTHIYDLNLNSCSSSCPSGYVDVGDNICTICPVGKYQDLQGQSACKDCVAGTFTQYDGLSGCNPCPSGYKCPGGTGKIPCEQGYYQDSSGAITCKACGAANKYRGSSPNGAPICLFVTAGWYSHGGTSTTRVGEVICPPGHYCVNGEKKECGAGKYQDASGATSCKDTQATHYSFGATLATGTSENVCDAGHYCLNGVRIPCSAGTFEGSTGQLSCSGSCTVGMSSPMGSISSAACSQCPAGRTSAGGQACAICSDGLD